MSEMSSDHPGSSASPPWTSHSDITQGLAGKAAAQDNPYPHPLPSRVRATPARPQDRFIQVPGALEPRTTLQTSAQPPSVMLTHGSPHWASAFPSENQQFHPLSVRTVGEVKWMVDLHTHSQETLHKWPPILTSSMVNSSPHPHLSPSAIWTPGLGFLVFVCFLFVFIFKKERGRIYPFHSPSS